MKNIFTHFIIISFFLLSNLPFLSSQTTEVVVNEFMASNDSAVADQNGEYDDWIELYNTSSEPVDLSGWHLTDDPNELDKWTFPLGTVIQGDAYMIVWADNDTTQAGLHTNFRLNADGESLLMSDPGNNIEQDITFGLQSTDLSYSRIPNGTGDFQIKDPTFGFNNETPSGIEELAYPGTIQLFPNPAITHLFVEVKDLPNAERLEIFNALGRRVYSGLVAANENLGIEIDDWSEGLYWLKIGPIVKRIVVE